MEYGKKTENHGSEAVRGACLNVKINAAGLKNRALADELVARAEAITAEAERLEADVIKTVESKI